MPTTVVKTIRASGGDYTTLTAWEAANQGDLVTADEVRVAECYNDWPGGLNDAVYLDGSTEDATRYLMITVAPGHRHDGTPGTGFHIRRDQDWLALVLLSASSRARLEWLDVRNGATNGTAYELQQGWATNCIARGGYRGFGSCRANSRLVNCLAIGPSSIAAFEFTDWQNAQALNCVAAGASYGFRYGNGTGAVLKNCVAYGNTTNYSGTYAAASTNNATSSASDDAPGANSVVGITSADFVNAAGNDFHLAAGSALIGTGVNLYADLQADVDGDAWPSSGAWDIGFDYYVAGGGGITAALNQATETDTAQAIAVSPIRRLLGQIVETDTAQAVARIKILAISQTTETDAAQAVSSRKVRAVGQAGETDTAQAIAEAGAITAAVGQVAEADSAQAIAVSPLRRLLGQAAEADSAQAIAEAGAIVAAVGQAQESDAAQAISSSKTLAVGMVTETEFAQAIAHYKTLGVLQTVESDSAHSIVPAAIRALNPASESDGALAIALAGGAVASLSAPRTTYSNTQTARRPRA